MSAWKDLETWQPYADLTALCDPGEDPRGKNDAACSGEQVESEAIKSRKVKPKQKQPNNTQHPPKPQIEGQGQAGTGHETRGLDDRDKTKKNGKK